MSPTASPASGARNAASGVPAGAQVLRPARFLSRGTSPASAVLSGPWHAVTLTCGWCAQQEEKTMTAPRPRSGQPKRLDAGRFQAEISSFRLHLAAEGKAAKTVRTYTEAVQFAAAHLLEKTRRTGWEQASGQDVQEWMVRLLDRYSSAYASNQYRGLQQFFKWLAAKRNSPTRWPGCSHRTSPSALSRSSPRRSYRGWSAPARAGHSSSAATPRSSRCSRRPASACRNWPASATTPVTRGAATSTCGSGRSPSAARPARPASSRSATTPPAPSTGTSASAPAHRPQLWLGAGSRGPLTASGIYQMIARRGRQCGVDVFPHRFRHHFSHTWLDRGGAEGDLMELNGWTSPQMLRRYGASARSARARRNYDRIMADAP